MRILITGSAGFVGAHFVEHFLSKTDWDIIGVDSFRHRGDSLRVQHLKSKRYQIHTHDLTSPFSYRQKQQLGKIDYILNLASMSHVDTSITDPVGFVENNVKLQLNILELARDKGVKAFQQLSTDEVFGPSIKGHNHKEWEPTRPSNPYAASKTAQDAICYSYWRTFSVPVQIVHSMNMFAERQDIEKFIPMLMSRISKGEVVTIHGQPHDIGSRYYIHARNLADAFLFLLGNKKPTMYKDLTSEIVDLDKYNVVGDRRIDNLQMAKLVAEFIGKDLKYEFEDFHKTRPGHDRDYGLNGDKIKALGWAPPVPFLDSLKKTVDWTLANPEWML